MLYSEAINYISNIERAGSDYGIERMRELLVLLGEPDKRLKFVHIAGTNGKGSVSAYLTSILKESGYKVGTYNSPSVFDYNERWLVNGEPVGDDQVADYMSVVRSAIEQERKARSFQPTAFEIETAVAFLAFADNDCDICVLETGLGGRWDATNAIYDKELAIITPIGLDHCALLGNTLSEIASEKAAIARDVVVTCPQSEEIMKEIANPFDVVDGVRLQRNAEVRVCEQAKILRSDASGQLFEYGGKEYRIKMLGKHQITNASISICAAEELRKKHWNISIDAIKNGLEKAIWHVRFEIVKNAKSAFNIDVPSGRTLVFDGSHNPQGAKTLAQGIKDYFSDKRVHLVFGMLKDKDIEGVARILAPCADKITCVTPPSPRALEKEELKRITSKYKTNCDVNGEIRSALENALSGDCDVVVLCGSLTLFAPLVTKRR